jgi:hypothetical protein
MLKTFALVALPALLIAASPAPSAQGATVDAALKRIYGGYLKESGSSGGDWDQPVFSAATTRLIKAWDKHNGEELTGMSDYGWFCECQDWLAKKFSWKRTGIRQLAPGKLEVTVKVNPGWGDLVTQRLILVLEGKRWMIDDLFSESAPNGVKAAMRQELTEKPGS